MKTYTTFTIKEAVGKVLSEPSLAEWRIRFTTSVHFSA